MRCRIGNVGCALSRRPPAWAEGNEPLGGVRSDQLESESEIKVEVVLMPDQELLPGALATFVNENTPYFFVPRYIEFVDELPRTPSGRVRKFEIRNRGVTDTTWDRKAAGFTVKR